MRPGRATCDVRYAPKEAFRDYVYEVTETSTSIFRKVSLMPKKLPDTGMHWRISRATATGIRLPPPTLRLVGSKVIQPAPGTKTSAQAWVEPAPVEPTRSWFG